MAAVVANAARAAVVRRQTRAETPGARVSVRTPYVAGSTKQAGTKM
jgi:hypothetical protein